MHKKSQTDKHEVVLKCSFYDDSLFSLSPIKGAFHFPYILQNTFLKAWLALDSFRGDSKISTWLFRIATNESLSFLQRKREALSLDDPEASVVESICSDEYFDGDEAQRRFMQAVASLPDKQRLVFNMRYFDEMKYEEMSDILGTSVGALKASYHIAVGKITEVLKKYD